MNKESQSIKEHQEVTTNKAITAHVRFGMVSRKCKSFGICEVQMISNHTSKIIKEEKGIVCKIEYTENNQLKFVLDTETITEEGYNKYFGKGYFKVGEAFTIPHSITEALGIEPFTIKVGNYVYFKEEKKYLLF